jgi:hypothetical protein
MHYDITPDFIPHSNQLSSLAKRCGMPRLHDVLEIFYHQEMVFLKTTEQHTLLEIVLLKIVQQQTQVHTPVSIQQNASGQDRETTQQNTVAKNLWEQFLIQISSIPDKSVISVLQQANLLLSDDKKVATLSFAQNKTFFAELIETTQELWFPLLQNVFGIDIRYVLVFDQKNIPPAKGVPRKISSPEQTTPITTAQTKPSNIVPTKELEQAQAILKHFPGAIVRYEDT